MLRAQLMFFLPLAFAATFIAWQGRSYPLHQGTLHYLSFVTAGWLGATSLLYLAMSLLTPSDGLKEERCDEACRRRQGQGQ